MKANKDFFRHTKSEIIYHQETHTINNVLQNISSGQRNNMKKWTVSKNVNRKNKYIIFQLNIFSEALQTRIKRSEMFKVLREKKRNLSNLKVHILKNYPSKVKKKYFLSWTKIERTCCQQTCLERNVKRSF